ncbi:MAG: hypothetical protein CFH35_01273, partial [Alphaproteobacteria bacterium MarineAlpha9_Bin5]
MNVIVTGDAELIGTGMCRMFIAHLGWS